MGRGYDTTMDLIAVHRRALLEFSQRVRSISPDQWGNSTPCTEWSVRDLVNHLVYEQLWVPPLLDGASVAEIGDRFDGDQLGADPVGTWDRAAAEAHQAFAAPGALDRTVELSYGSRPASEYCLEMVCDLVVHAWDLARGIGSDDTLHAGLVDVVWTHVQDVPDMSSSGMFAAPVEAPDDADTQTKMLARLGRAA